MAAHRHISLSDHAGRDLDPLQGLALGVMQLDDAILGRQLAEQMPVNLRHPLSRVKLGRGLGMLVQPAFGLDVR